MQTAGIVIDKWKLSIFRRALDDGAYKYEEHDGPIKDTIAIIVETRNITRLGAIIKAANNQAAKWHNPND